MLFPEHRNPVAARRAEELLPQLDVVESVSLQFGGTDFWRMMKIKSGKRFPELVAMRRK